MRRSLPASVAPLLSGATLALIVTSFACGDLKSATEVPPDAGANDGAGGSSGQPSSDGGDAASEPRGDAGGDAAADANDSLRGPGTHGSLPSGYCCTANSECRYRRCVDTTDAGGTGKMCLDECFDTLFCTRPDITFSCEQPMPSARGLCKPPAGFACIPAQQFVRGTLPPGACCNGGSPAMNDGTAASACEGNQCTATGNGPLVCTNRCSVQADCPGGFVCNDSGTSKACVRPTESYTCN